MAKIGVLTFANTIDNYGQVLQYLATQEYLRNRGNEVFLLNITGHRPTLGQRIERKLRATIQKIFLRTNHQAPQNNTHELPAEEMAKAKVFDHWAEVTNRTETLHPRYFKEFRRKNFNILTDSYEGILKQGFNAFCIGSDQTWSGAGEHYLLGWCGRKYIKFTIAPSVGHRVYTDSEIDGFKPLIKKFKFITVREQNGIDFCERCGRYDAIKVLDPTFLLPPSEYLKYAFPPIDKTPYVFIYMLGGEISISIHDIITTCQKKGYQIKYVESQGREEPEEKLYPTVGEWLGLMQHASFVVTNSFHGMALSIINKKPFVVFPLIGLMKGMNGRIFDLASKMGLSHRIFSKSLDVLWESVDWSCAEKEIEVNKSLMGEKLSSIGL